MKLDQKKIQYTTSDDFSTLIEKGFMSMPILEVDGEFMEFANAVKYVNEL